MADDPLPPSPSGRKRAWRWRDHVKIHPAAELFPLMAPDELQKLAEDIKQNGVRVVPVFFRDEHGLRLLDGRNRLDAAELAGDFRYGGPLQEYLDSEFEDVNYEVHQPPEDPYELVVALNILRRHLTREQKQELVDRLLIENPDRSDRQTAALAHVSPTTAGTRRQRLEERGAIPKVTETVGADGRIRTATPARKTRKDEEVGALAKWLGEGSVPAMLDAVPAAEPTPEPTPAAKVEHTPMLMLASDFAPDQIDATAERFVERYGREDAVRFSEALAKVVYDKPALLPLDGPAASPAASQDGPDPDAADDAVFNQLAADFEACGIKFQPGQLRAWVEKGYEEGIFKISKPEFDRLVTQAEQRLGKDVVAAVKQAHRNGRYQNDWAPILKELASKFTP